MDQSKISKRFLGLYSSFDPLLVILQIFSLQFLFYSGLSFLLVMLDFAFGLQIHFGQLFHFSCFNTDHLYGTIDLIAYFLNIPILIIGLIQIVVKASKILDFIATLFLIHLILCLIYNWGTPHKEELQKKEEGGGGWLFINFVVFLITVLVGEWICIKIEQKEIQLVDSMMGLGTRKKKNEMELNEVKLV